MDGRIFINYDRTDLAYVQRLDGYLREHDLEAFISFAGNPGQELARTLTEQVDQIAALVVVVSPESSRSSFVKWAIEYALFHNKPVVPLLLGGAPHRRLVNHHHEDVQHGQMPSAIFVERLRSLVREVGSGADVHEMPFAQAYGQITDIRERLGATLLWSLVVIAGAGLGWWATGYWSESIQGRYGAAAGMAVVIAALAVALRLPRIAAGFFWASIAIGGFLAVAAIVLLWQFSHGQVGSQAPAEALAAAVVWSLGSRQLAKVISGEAKIKMTARVHALVRQRAAARFWLSAGAPPSVFGRVLTDHVRGVRTPDKYFRFALAASSSVVFVDTSGMTTHPSFTAKATELAEWTRGILGRPHRSMNVSATFVAIDDKAPVTAVTTVGDVDIVRVSTERFAPTVAPLLERGYPWLYLPLLVALLSRTPIVPWWRRWYLKSKAWLGFA